MTVHYKSTNTFENSMYLDLQGNHLSHIQNIDAYAKRFQCPYCDYSKFCCVSYDLDELLLQMLTHMYNIAQKVKSMVDSFKDPLSTHASDSTGTGSSSSSTKPNSSMP